MAWEIPQSAYERIAKNAIQTAEQRLIAFFSKYLKQGTGGKNTPIAPSDSSLLQSRTGNLLRSLMPKRDGNISKVEATSNGFDWTFGTSLNYASVHENGGFIKSKGRMHKYFWAKYYESNKGNQYYRNLALSVKKKGGINIPKRPFFNPAIKDFDERPEGAQLLLNEIFKQLAKEFDK